MNNNGMNISDRKKYGIDADKKKLYSELLEEKKCAA